MQTKAKKSSQKPRSARRSLPPPVVLLTGFDANPGYAFNASSQAVKAFDGAEIGGYSIVTAELPTVFRASLATLRKLIARHKPKLVICAGEAGRRNAVSVERIAINIDDASRPDNHGNQPTDKPVIRGAPAAYFSTLPVRAIQDALKKANIPVEISQSAGTFVCNHVFYGLMHDLATRKALRGVRGGFIHIPFLQGQDPAIPGMPLEQIVAGLRLAIAASANARRRLLP